MKKKRKMKMSDLLADSLIYLVLLGLVIVSLYPMWYVIAASFTSSAELAANPGLYFWPKDFVIEAYTLAFENALILGAFRNSLVILIVGLPINLIMTLFCAYFMASTGMMWKKMVIGMIMFTMFFSGGLIPSYLNVRSLGLMNTMWALILPGAISVYNAIICKTAMEAIPPSLTESAYLDGANDFQVLGRIIVPLMKPTLAVLLLYYGVGHWNSWFNASIYIKDNVHLPIQNIIRAFLLENSALKANGIEDDYNAYAETIKYAAIVISTLPILCIYPFLQKYFTKGVMIGAVKG